jgi:hypothetical protein
MNLEKVLAARVLRSSNQQVVLGASDCFPISTQTDVLVLYIYELIIRFWNSGTAVERSIDTTPGPLPHGQLIKGTPNLFHFANAMDPDIYNLVSIHQLGWGLVELIDHGPAEVRNLALQCLNLAGISEDLDLRKHYLMVPTFSHGALTSANNNTMFVGQRLWDVCHNRDNESAAVRTFAFAQLSFFHRRRNQSIDFNRLEVVINALADVPNT